MNRKRGTVQLKTRQEMQQDSKFKISMNNNKFSYDKEKRLNSCSISTGQVTSQEIKKVLGNIQVTTSANLVSFLDQLDG
jgi:hypothetical protein